MDVVGRGDSESRPPFTVAISILAIVTVTVTGMALRGERRGGGGIESIWMVRTQASW
jgi:hypothetical protein